MRLELYNTTNKIKIIPKYRYNGTYTIRPYGTVEIEEFTSTFFRPYSRIGIIVRVKEEATKVEQDKESENIKIEDSAGIESKPTSVAIDTDERKDLNEDTMNNNKFTEDELYEKSMKDLKELADSLGLEVADTRKKGSLVQTILAANK